MATLFEYIISIQDKASAAAKKIDGAVGMANKEMKEIVANAAAAQNKATAAFGALASKAKQAIAGPQFLRKSIDELEEKLKEVNRVRFGTVLKSEFKEATREAEKLEQKINRLKQGITGSGFGSKIAGWRKDFVSSLPGARLLGNPLTMAGAAIGGFWGATQKAMEAGKEKMQMQVLTGSEQIGTTLFNGLTKFATDTVFGNEVYDFGTQMLANGIKNADVMPIMKQLGDISMGSAEKLGQLSLAFAQVNGKGHLAGQELLQFINAGFNPLQTISEKTGVSMAKLTEKMSKGQISVADVRKSLEMATGPEGKFAGMLDKIANTPYGRLEQLKGQIDQMMIKIGSVFLPIASKALKMISSIVDYLGPHLKTLAATIGGLAALILGVAAAQAAWTFSTTTLATALTSNLGIIGLTIAAVGGLVAVYNNLTGAMDRAKNMANGFNQDAYDETKANTTKTLDKVVGKDQLQRRINLLDAQKYRIEDAYLKTKGEYEQMQKVIEASPGGTINEAYTHQLLRKGMEMGILKSQLKANEDIRNKIDPSRIPGASGKGAGAGTGEDKTKDSREAVATGGTKNTTINIHIGKQIESLTVLSNNLKEGAAKIRDVVVEEMTRAAAMAGALAG